MEYGELIDALRQGDREKTDLLLYKIIPRARRYLLIHMNASRQDAEDCTQQALLDTIQKIRAGEINTPKHIFSYIITACRNNYLDLIRADRGESFEKHASDLGQRPRQLFSLLDSERRRVLQSCIEQLSDTYRTFIEYWFRYPECKTKAVSSHFGISMSNVWTRKHRVLKKIHQCYEHKSNI